MRQKIDIHVPVLIVGDGGAGLTSSILLSRSGVSSLLVTRHPETTNLPRGHILNQRTLEILTDMGVADDVKAKATPPENMRGLAWYSGLGGGGPEDGHGRLLGFAEAWGGGPTPTTSLRAPRRVAISPSCVWSRSSRPMRRATRKRPSGSGTSWWVSSRMPTV